MAVVALPYAGICGKRGPSASLRPFTAFLLGLYQMWDNPSRETSPRKDVVWVASSLDDQPKKGMATPRRDIDLIKARLRMAGQIHEARSSQKEGP